MDTDPLPTHLTSVPFLLDMQGIRFIMPDNWGTWSLTVAVAALCLLLSAFVSGSEIAFFGLSENDVDSLEEESPDKPGIKKALKMLRNSEQLLASILITNNLVNISLVVLLSYAFNRIAVIASPVVDFLLQTVLLTFILLLFGEIFPKLVARTHSKPWVAMAASPLWAVYRLTAPLARMMVRSSGIISKVVTKKDENLSTDELEKALSISDIEEGEDKDMLEGILSFGQKEAADIMISRVDITAIEYHDSWAEAMDVILKSGYSRIPVYDTSQDTIRGILYSKDLLPYIGKRNDGFRWQALLRAPYFVPESRPIDDLLEDFRTRKTHIAIVVDEYGCTQGMVTLEDVIEEIVGEIDDEYDEQTSLFKKINSNTFIFDAKIQIGEFCKALDIVETELGDTGEAETLAGLILEIKGDFPSLKETLRRGKLRFQVVQKEKLRITKVKVMLGSSPASET